MMQIRDCFVVLPRLKKVMAKVLIMQLNENCVVCVVFVAHCE